MLRMMSMKPAERAQAANDPVCGMPVDPLTAAHLAEYRGTGYSFCSSGCRETFVKDPARYAPIPTGTESAVD
jgi:Cu+-exporting ATPase